MGNDNLKQKLSIEISTKKKIYLDVLGEIVELNSIGEGGNSKVYSGKFQNKEVALKFLCDLDKGKKQRFLSEYYNIQKISNKHIIRYISLDKIRLGEYELLVIVMEKHEGSLKRQDITTKEGFNKLLNFLLDSIEIVHPSIIHRDLKPENILVSNRDEYILSDFGISYYNDLSHIKHNTKIGERLGNRLFSAPEQEEKNVDAKETMDIYAIGQILYRYVTGDRIVGTGQKRISDIINDLDPGIDKMIAKCTSIEPEKRFQSILEIREFLKSSQEVNPLVCISLFDQICRSIFPKKDNYGISYTEDLIKIDAFFNELAKNAKNFGSHLWYNYSTDGRVCGNMYFHPRKVHGMRKLVMGEYTEKNGTKGCAYNIKRMRAYRDVYEMKDFVLINYSAGDPVIIDGKESYGYYLIDNKHIVSFEEGDEGYAEVNGKIYNLDQYPGEFIEVERNEGYLFIATNFNTILYENSDSKIKEFISLLLNKEIEISNKVISDFGDSLKINRGKYEKYGFLF